MCAEHTLLELKEASYLFIFLCALNWPIMLEHRTIVAFYCLSWYIGLFVNILKHKFKHILGCLDIITWLFVI